MSEAKVVIDESSAANHTKPSRSMSQIALNFTIFMISLLLVILILDYPFKIMALEKEEQALVQELEAKLKAKTVVEDMGREDKQLWHFLPSPFLLADSRLDVWTPPSLGASAASEVGGSEKKEAAKTILQATSRGLIPDDDAGAKLSEISIFSKFTKPMLKLDDYEAGPTEKDDRFSGEVDKTEQNERLSQDTWDLLPRSKSVLPGDFQSRTNEDLEFVESVNSLLGSLSRQAIDNYYTASEDREAAMLEPEELIIPYPTPRQASSSVKAFDRPDDCCLFVFLDGSAYYFDEFLRKLTGFYRLMYGTVNGHPHYVARNCKSPESYNGNCTYIWYSGYGWVVGIGRYIGQTKGVIYTKQESVCPSGLTNWRYLNEELEWKDNGNIVMHCAS